MTKFPWDPVPHSLVEAIDAARTAFRRAGFEPPTAMVVGEDVQRAMLYGGMRPNMDGSWGTIMGIEVRGVSDYIRALLDHGRLVFMPEHLRQPPFKIQVLGHFQENEDNAE